MLKKVFVSFIFFSVLILAAGFFYLNDRFNKIETSLHDLESRKTSTEITDAEKSLFVIPPENESECGSECQEIIDQKISKAIEELDIPSTTIVEKVVSSGKKTTYIPLGSTFSTQSTTWVDVPDSGVYVDAENDYGGGAKLSWEASLKVAHGNGKAFARLFDDTNKIGVDFSEITSENNSAYEEVSSPNLPFWRGRNLYKVQVKSLNSYEVTYSGGRIKVYY